jgi:hypothetical protein
MRMLIAVALTAATVASPALAAPGRGGRAAAVVAVSLDDAAALAPGGFVWADSAGNAGPLSVVVSLPDQRAYVYRGPALVAVTTVSTGKQGKDTPIGSYPILQKEVVHKSSLYDDAPMPFMQRLTWDGVALHAGANPGFPASHGCVRMPTAFAKKLFAVTRVGTSVSVIDASVDGSPAPQNRDEVTGASREETASANEQQLAAVQN